MIFEFLVKLTLMEEIGGNGDLSRIIIHVRDGRILQGSKRASYNRRFILLAGIPWRTDASIKES